MNSKNKNDLMILTAVLLFLLIATAGVVLHFGRTGKRLEQTEPKRVQEWRNQLSVLVNRRRFSEAEIVVNRILIAVPDDVEMLRAAGMITFQNRKYKEARHLLGRLLVMEPENIVTRCNYALALAGMGQNGQALEELRRTYRDSGGAAFVYRLFYGVAARSNYTGDSLDDMAVTETGTPEGLFDIPQQKGKQK